MVQHPNHGKPSFFCMLKIAIFRWNAEILLQSIISDGNNRTFGIHTLQSKNRKMLKIMKTDWIGR